MIDKYRDNIRAKDFTYVIYVISYVIQIFSY